MQFGVEVELGTYYPQVIADKLVERGILTMKEEYRDTDCGCEHCKHPDHQQPEEYSGDFILSKHSDYDKKFKVKPESSLDPGFEINTPIMTDLAELRYLEVIMNAARKEKVEITEKCGIHIHIGTKWKNRIASEQGREILRAMWANTKLPEKFKPNNFRRKHYSLNGGINNSKHSPINYLTQYDTLEYRIFDCKWSIKYIMSAVEFCQNFSRQLNAKLKEQGLISPKGQGIPTPFKRKKPTKQAPHWNTGPDPYDPF